MFIKGFVIAVLSGIVGYLVVSSGVEPANITLGAALLGGVAYLIGFAHGNDAGVTETAKDQGNDNGDDGGFGTPTPESEPGFTK